MAFLGLKQLLPCLCKILLLLLSIVSLCLAKERRCKHGESYQEDRRSNHTMQHCDLFLIDKDYGLIETTRNLSNAKANNTRVLSTIYPSMRLWKRRPDGSGVDESSFSATFIYRPLNVPSRRKEEAGLTFLVLPSEAIDQFPQVNKSLPLARLLSNISTSFGSLYLANSTLHKSNSDSLPVIIEIGTLSIDGKGIVGINFLIDGVSAGSSSYSMWIDYDRVGRRLSVYLVMENTPKPYIAIAETQLNISSFFSQYVVFGVVSTGEQLLLTAGINLTATIEDLPYYQPDKGFLAKKVTILSSVLGSVAATAVMVTAVAYYFNSRYRRWHRELDKLARSMGRLPGVPTKVDFADINKATGNFHDTMKLGGGGFGTVYRCTLPAATSRTEQPMDVAVKRFTRDVQNQRYKDFLDEVSIINRLRHRNIVPLVGWSYNKGEPLLVFEYMTNGSLDQHLFPKGGTGTRNGQRDADAPIQQWSTRYEIIRGIATGLHYVHHEYEPMVLHCDIKASNVMLDSSFRARLGDFGLACIVAVDRNSATGVGGTWGYIAPEYAMCHKATRKTDIYALGVLILEVVTGQRALAKNLVGDGNDHITDRVWQLHSEGRLLECVDAVLTAASSPDDEEKRNIGGDAERLLLLGLACSNPNPSDRPSMPDVVQVIAKSAALPEVPPQKPRFVWPPPEGEASDDDTMGASMMSDLDWSTDEEQVSLRLPMTRTDGRYVSFQLHSAHERATGRRASFQLQHSA